MIGERRDQIPAACLFRCPSALEARCNQDTAVSRVVDLCREVDHALTPDWLSNRDLGFLLDHEEARVLRVLDHYYQMQLLVAEVFLVVILNNCCLEIIKRSGVQDNVHARPDPKLELDAREQIVVAEVYRVFDLEDLAE